jgi:hypothetical protein
VSERIQCFFLSPSDVALRALRRFTWSDRGTCPIHGDYGHDASIELERVPADTVLEYGAAGFGTCEPPEDVPFGDARWPIACACSYAFTPEDQWQYKVTRLYRRSDTGELLTLRDAPVGAMWNADWMLEGVPPESNRWRGPDGHCLVVRTPGGDWTVDGRASNCTMPGDDTHKCWVRHGVPPLVTVSKQGGPTCAAGAGSILSGSYHGFLRDGQLVSC